MKAIVFHGIGDVRLDNLPEPKLKQPTDAIVRITASAIDAYRHFDRHRAGWLKVKLEPAQAQKAA